MSEYEEIDGRPVAGGLGGVGRRQRTEHVPGEFDDLVGRPVGDAQRLDGDVGQPELTEHRLPIREAVVHQQTLRDVSGQGHAARWADRVEHHRQLDGREVLGFVDHDVLVDQGVFALHVAHQRTTEALTEPQ